MAGRKVFMEVVRKAQPDLVVSTHDIEPRIFLGGAGGIAGVAAEVA